jgi:hypothetical protein
MQYETKSGIIIDFDAKIKEFKNSRGADEHIEFFDDVDVEIVDIKVYDQDGNELDPSVAEHFMSALEEKAVENHMKNR